jgi:GTP-binding protein
LKTILIIGKPNVGKSSLFNLLCKQRDAITSDVSGTTRDIKKGMLYIDDRSASIVDSGGIDDSTTMFCSVKDKALEYADKADMILYMVDGRVFPSDEDKKLFYKLQSKTKNIALVVNKLDNDKLKTNEWNFENFGIDNIFGISVVHNRYMTDLKTWIYNLLDREEKFEISNEENFEDILDVIEGNEQEKTKELRVAIIGRVNVGKSSILNALVGSQRSVVSDVAGTTIDPVDETVIFDNSLVTFVDTAGIRRRSKIEGIEKFALMRTNNMLEGTDIAVLVLDVSEELVDLDEKIAGIASKFELGIIVVFNKWDKTKYDFEATKKSFRNRFRFLEFAPIMTLSAVNHRNIDKLKIKIIEVYENFTRRISTSKINETILEAQRRHALPSDNGKMVKIYYATQFQSAPPKISLISNRPSSIHFSYKRYLINFLREKYNFEGTPIIIKTRNRKKEEVIR